MSEVRFKVSKLDDDPESGEAASNTETKTDKHDDLSNVKINIIAADSPGEYFNNIQSNLNELKHDITL